MAPLQVQTRRPKRKKRRTKSAYDHNFSSYLSFGLQATVCIGCFFITYILVLLCLLPMVDQANQVSDGVPTSPLDGAHLPHAPGQEKLKMAAVVVKDQLRRIRQGQGVSDESLLEAAEAEFKVLRAEEQGRLIQKKQDAAGFEASSSMKKDRAGFVVLGMHRSGTSMLSGLLVTGMGYNVGGPLIAPSFDNEKGFFERIDVVLQNDEFFNVQKMGWSWNVIKYDSDLALEHKKSGKVIFQDGEKGLRFLNDPSNAPWLQKDPRMCITLKTWLSLINTEPAAVFTYRHPLEVAMSLHKREEDFGIDHGLRLWIVYNMRAIQNSSGLCRVFSANEVLLTDPIGEVTRIADELTSKCGIPSPPRRISQEEVDKFVDPSLHHNKKKESEGAEEKRVLATFDGCEVRDEISDKLGGLSNGIKEEKLYLKAMKMYCDFQSGKAYEEGYEWPSLD